MTEVVGLEIAGTELRVARAVHRLGRIRLAGCERIPVADPAALAQALAAVAATRPASVALALPLARTTHRLLELPFTDARRIRETAPLELVGRLPGEPGDLVVGHARIARSSGGATVLAAVARRADLRRLVEPVVAAGIPVARLALAVSGLARLPGVTDVPGAAVVLADGPRSAVLARRDGALTGLRALAARPADGLDAFVREVRWALAALAAPGPVVLCGADAGPALQAALGAAGDRDVTLLGADAAAGGGGLSACAAAAAIALGHGLVMDEGADAGEVARRTRRVAALGAAAALLAVVDLGLLRAGLATRDARLVTAIRETAAAALPPGTRLVAPRAQLEAAAGAAAARAGSAASVLALLRELSARMPSSVRLDLDELVVEPDALRLHGRTDRFESIDAVARALGASAVLRDVAVEESRATVDGRGVEFGIRAGWRAPAGAPS